MSWLHPAAHIAWIAVILAAGLFWLAATYRRRLNSQMGDDGTMARLGAESDRIRRLGRSSVMLIGLGLLVVAMAGPRFGTEPREVELAGLDLVVALDVSRSMLAEDVAPSRLERAREEVARLAMRIGDDRIGLITFAADAYLQMPLTRDRSALRLYLGTASPDMIPAQGTSFANVLAVAARTFESGTDSDGRSRVLLIVSDGEDYEGGLDPHLRRLEEGGVRIITLGIGTREGAHIPLERDGEIVLHRDRAGQIVRTHLEDDLLKRIASDGHYFEITRATSAVDRLTDALDRLERGTYGSVVYESHVERYQVPLAAALLLFVVDTFLRDRRRQHRREVGA
jgi:Ca-activated chloride channel homolog